MSFNQKRTKFFLFVSSIFLMMTLASLTVSLPFVYGAKQIIEFNIDSLAELPEDCESETDNPFANATEEKTPNNISSASEEYLHDTHSSDQYLAALSSEYIVAHDSVYSAFYGDLISPPPDLS